MNKSGALLCFLISFCVGEAQAAHSHKDASAAASPQEYPCPAEIHVKPDQADNVEGFMLWSDPQARTQLVGITLYDGQPSQMAQLKPDNGDDPQAKEYKWTLYANPRGYWMVCSYSNTAERFTRQLSNPQRACVTKTQDSVQVSLTCE